MLPFSAYKKIYGSHDGTLCELIEFDENKISLFASKINYCQSHWHEAPELIAIVSGSYGIFINSHEYEIKAPGLIYINKDHIHSLRALDHDSLLITLQFSPNLFDHKYKAPYLNNAQISLYEGSAEYADKAAEILNNFKRLIGLEAEDCRQNYFAMMAQVYSMLSALDDLAVLQSTPSGDSHSADKDEMQALSDHRYRSIRECIAYINHNYDQDITLEDLADRVNVSYTHLSRMFKKFCKINFKEYLTLTRISRAKILLRNSNYQVSDIAGLCGFGNDARFIVIFKKYTGLTPVAFRKQRETEYRNNIALTHEEEAESQSVKECYVPLDHKALEGFRKSFKI